MRSCTSRGARWIALAIGGVTGWVLALAPARADEPMFGYVNATDLLPRGKSQIEQHLTLRSGPAGDRWEGRSEAEYGLSDNLQLTGYLNYAREAGRTRLDGVTAEAIWRLASPYLSPVGFALLADATAGRQEQARIRAIVQKNLNDDTVILAANLTAETARDPRLTAYEAGLGTSIRFRPNWSAGVEYRRRSERVAGTRYRADLLGPNLHYGAQRWFFTLTALRRIGASARGPAAGAPRLRWDGVRFRIGRTF